MIKFKQCLKKFSDINSSSVLCLDVPTRWNSTFLMLQSALKYQRVFGSLHLVDENYKYFPSDEEWERATKICKFLQPFYEITTLISGTSYPTSNLYFLQVWKIQCLLMGSVTDEDKVVRDMAGLMIEKFEKYWDEYSVVLAFDAILDPRMKLETLGYCYERIDSLTWEIKLEKVKEKVYMLFSHYFSYGSKLNAQNLKRKDVSSSSLINSKPSLFM
uniref:AC transposase n=1 Tax=Cajanus cajan TaxID=3821 RepID=A0A151U3C8_CAJCA|nr:Putative AC transposase [Cajanus cajan]